MRKHHNVEPSEQTLSLMAHVPEPATGLVATVPEQTRQASSVHQYRPLAVLGVALMLGAHDVDDDNPIPGLYAATDLIQAKAEAVGGHVQLGVEGSLLITFGFPSLVERPAHTCARLACSLRETVLPDGIRASMGLHADVGVLPADNPQHLAR